MTEIKAYIRETKFEQVVRALEAAGVKRLTAVRTMPVWTDVEPEFVDISTAQPSAHYAPVVKIELVCREQDADRYAAIIADQARTGRPGDGSIFLSTVDAAVQIRTGRKDEAAL